jgi:hypothetical protein
MIQPNPWLGFLPIAILSVPLAFVCYCLAKAKLRNAPLFFVLGLIPIVNGFITVYLVGAPDLGLHSKLDRLLPELERSRSTAP